MSNFNIKCCADTEMLYTSLNKVLRQFIIKRVNEKEAVEDILHEVFLKIHNNISSLKNPNKVESWVFQITRNSIIDYYRSRKGSIEMEEDVIKVNDDCEDDTHLKASEGITEFVLQLPEIYKQAILLTEYEGLTQKQLAERVNISLTGAKSRVQRARKMLKDMLLNCCHFEYDKYGTVIDYHKVCCCCSSKKNI